MLVAYIPSAYLPDTFVAVGWIGIDLCLAAVVLRRLQLPPWWLAFPPLFIAIFLGSIEIPMTAILVLGGRWSGLAALLKPYALLPLIAEQRWRPIAVCGAVWAVSLIVLPWGTLFGDLGLVRAAFERQWDPNDANAFGNSILPIVTVLALLSLGVRRALWLSAPVLWPLGHRHYAAMTLPVIPPATALFWALPVPGALVAGILAGAVVERFELARQRMRVRYLQSTPTGQLESVADRNHIR
jgi:hypothetical protein